MKSMKARVGKTQAEGVTAAVGARRQGSYSNTQHLDPGGDLHESM